MTKKIITLVFLLLVLGGIAWGIHAMLAPVPASGQQNTSAIISNP